MLLILNIMEKGKTGTDAVATNWTDQKRKLKAKFSSLTDADLHFEAGKKDEMLKKVQAKLGKTKEEFATLISNL
jgi:uncharacterized protein YjbJ (UPF0337 family)